MLCRAKNWAEYQHYTNRNPPWIKLHVALLNDAEFMALAPASKCLLMLSWILASENGGEVDMSLENLRFRLRWPKLQMKEVQALVSKGFLVPLLADASSALALAPPSVSVVSASSVSASSKEETVKLPSALCGNGFEAKWSEWIDYRRGMKKPVSAVAAEKQLAKLAEHPETAKATIDASIANDWQGLFPEKLTPKRGSTAPDPAVDWSKEQGVRSP